ncbi:MAG: hypothetical protein HY236_17750 [Acidobacteria bacterium]|nr:hypothetical protein [Acidobacteriota bacterium]
MILRLLALALLIAAPAAPALSLEDSRSAKRKLERVQDRKMTPGERLVLSENEINSYLRYDYADELPAGLSDPLLRLEPDRVTGSGLVDFVEWRAADGSSPGPFLTWLLAGRRRVEAVCRFTSANGYGRTDIEAVRIAGFTISASTVTFLIENLVRPRYAAAVVGRTVALGYNLQQVRVERSRAVLVAR